MVHKSDVILPHQNDIKTEIEEQARCQIDFLLKDSDEINELHKFINQIIESIEEY